MIQTFQEFHSINEGRKINSAEKAFFKKLVSAKDVKSQLQVLKEKYDDEIVGEDFYQGPPPVDKDLEKSLDIINDLTEAGYLTKPDDDDDFLQKYTKKALKLLEE